MKTSKAGRDFIKLEEGLSLQVYDDVAGYGTIGYGHLLTRGEVFTTVTLEEAEGL